MTTLNNLKQQFEERFHAKWTSLSVQYHFKALVNKIFDIPFNEVAFKLSSSVNDAELKKFQEYILRLETNEPLQHIVGETEFMGFPIICSPSALIPRPETEELVELVINTLKEHNQYNIEILDLCTGTGCIAIALKKLLPTASVSGLDNFEDTIELAKKNCILNEVNIQIDKVDVLSENEMNTLSEKHFDIWVSNPPYIPIMDKLDMEENVLGYEPDSALFVPNNDPLLFYSIITKNAVQSLNENGWLFFEIHEKFGKEMIALLERFNFKNINLVDDMQGKNRMIYGQKLSK